MKKKNIYFNDDNLSEVQAAIDIAEKKARTRKSSASDFLKILNEMLHNYNLTYLPKAVLKDMHIKIQPYCDRFPSAYHGRPESTVIELIHNGKQWVLYNVYRDDCNKSPKNQFLITKFPEETKTMLIDRMCKGTLY